MLPCLGPELYGRKHWENERLNSGSPGPIPQVYSGEDGVQPPFHKVKLVVLEDLVILIEAVEGVSQYHLNGTMRYPLHKHNSQILNPVLLRSVNPIISQNDSYNGAAGGKCPVILG